jgi:hypothetical protein
VRLTALAHAIHTDDPNFNYASAMLWTEFEMHYNLVAATIPCLRIFLRAFHTGKLGGVVDDLDPLDSRFATKGSGTRTLAHPVRRQATAQEDGRMARNLQV